MADLSVELCGLTLRTPIMPGSGPNVADGTLLRAAAEGGAGALVTHTVSTLPAPALTPYREVRGGMLNNQLWSAHPVERWIDRDYGEAREAAHAAGIPLIINIGYTTAEIAALTPKVARFADALEISLHYARTSGDLMTDPATAAYAAAHQPADYLSRSPAMLVETIRMAKRLAPLPLFVKLPILGNELVAIARACEEAGADAIVAVNAFGPCMSIDIETAEPVLTGDGMGWLSGQALKPLALRCIFDLARAVSLPIIGCGGVSRPEDAVEMLMAGASAVQVCTAALQRGPMIYGSLASGVEAWLDERGYASVHAIVGLGVQRWRTLVAHRQSVPVLYQEEECIGCKLCERSCHYDAIYMVDKLAEFNPERCFGCGLCVTRCPTDALLMPQVTQSGVLHPLFGTPVEAGRSGRGHAVETTGRQV
ncbi:MAG: 4Fe-4S dicluster domain-containing protein [Chloroflexia bacterium]|nr:4Fe-4S dicluster domain-containing protein [Chloroflexia bacterium]